MSRDQKPGKLRVVGGPAPAAAPTAAPAGKAAIAASAEAAGAAPAATAGSARLMAPILVFLIACALGGAIAAYLGLAR